MVSLPLLRVEMAPLPLGKKAVITVWVWFWSLRCSCCRACMALRPYSTAATAVVAMILQTPGCRGAQPGGAVGGVSSQIWSQVVAVRLVSESLQVAQCAQAREAGQRCKGESPEWKILPKQGVTSQGSDLAVWKSNRG